MTDPLSVIWECPLCTAKIEVPRTPGFYDWPDYSKVEAHKKDHQRFGLMLS